VQERGESVTGTRSYAVARWCVVALGLVALSVQFRGALHDPEKTAADYFSEFTTQSTLLAAAVLGVGGWFLWAGRETGHRWDALRGASVTYMALTGIVFYFLVAGTRESAGPSYYHEWASHVLHRVIPVALLVDWLVMPARLQLRYRTAMAWTVYPLLYCAYSLIRGPIVDWYPYNFLDPDEGGYGEVAIYVVAIFIGFLVFSLLVVTLGNVAREWRVRRAPVAAEGAA
jgi:hypothetical protein